MKDTAKGFGTDQEILLDNPTRKSALIYLDNLKKKLIKDSKAGKTSFVLV